MFSALQLLDMQLLNDVVLIVWKYKMKMNLTMKKGLLKKMTALYL